MMEKNVHSVLQCRKISVIELSTTSTMVYFQLDRETVILSLNFSGFPLTCNKDFDLSGLVSSSTQVKKYEGN